ncbi:MAG: TolC family protein, partial [Myxococcota bacterium]
MKRLLFAFACVWCGWIEPASAAAQDSSPPSVTVDDPSGLSKLVAEAVENNPSLRARFNRWRELSLQVSTANTLPEPTLSVAYFVRAVETRVGPQRARFALRQRVPWPTKLDASREHAAATALAERRALDAEVLALRRDVALEYWQIWELQRALELHREHLTVLEALSASVRSRVETGRATVADLQQVELTLERLADQVMTLESRMERRTARLAELVGAPGTLALTPMDTPRSELELPYEASVLEGAPERHPSPASFRELGRAATAHARHASASRWPDFTLGVEWIPTDDARIPDTPGSGQDAWIAGVSLDLPVWRGSYSDAIDAAAARVDAANARAQG